MLKKWLKVINQDKDYVDRFSVNNIHENSKVTGQLKNYLIELFKLSTVDPELLDLVKNMEGWETAYHILIQPALPTNFRFKRGFFGEVLTSNLLIEIFDYILPIKKLEYSLNNQTLPGTDVIAIKGKNNVIYEICYLESKVRTTASGINDSAKSAYNQLNKDLSLKIPVISSFLLKRLHATNNPLFNNFYNYLRNRRDNFDREVFRIGIICERKLWNKKALEELHKFIDPSLAQNIIVDIILVNDLAELVDELFSSLGIQVECVDE